VCFKNEFASKAILTQTHIWLSPPYINDVWSSPIHVWIHQFFLLESLATLRSSRMFKRTYKWHWKWCIEIANSVGMVMKWNGNEVL